MRMCRGRLRAATVDGAEAGRARPRGSSSTESIGGVEASGTDELGTSGAGVDGHATGAVLDSEVDVPFEVVSGERGEWWMWMQER
jgi:hypothetical protein